MLVSQLQPFLAPVTERPEHALQVAAGVGELVDGAVARRLGVSVDNPDPFEQA